MKLKLKVNLGDGTPEKEVTTNMFVICEWEKNENRKISDNKGIGYSDIACWAHTLFKVAGEKVPANYREWVKLNPDMTIEAVDETIPNPTE